MNQEQLQERYQKVAASSRLKEYMDRIAVAERDRIFCKHDWDHLLAVARIAYILVLESGLGISKDIVYATALLHDIGKEAQYKKGIPHEIEGAVLAEGILTDCGYDTDECRLILNAILHHRTYDERNTTFEKLIYKADKLSRPCKSCQASEMCNWPDSKKNLGVYI